MNSEQQLTLSLVSTAEIDGISWIPYGHSGARAPASFPVRPLSRRQATPQSFGNRVILAAIKFGTGNFYPTKMDMT